MGNLINLSYSDFNKMQIYSGIKIIKYTPTNHYINELHIKRTLKLWCEQNNLPSLFISDLEWCIEKNWKGIKANDYNSLIKENRFVDLIKKIMPQYILKKWQKLNYIPKSLK